MAHVNWGFLGIYDQRTISFLKENRVKLFSFDFRPRSMNFLQGHRFLDILEEFYSHSDNYMLHFEHEKNFVIQKIVSDVANFLDDDLLRNQFYLMFSDDCETQYYDQFKIPYYWVYKENNQLTSHVKSSYLKGVILPYMLLENYFYEGTLPGFLQTFSTFLLGRKVSVLLEGHWQMEIIPDIIKYVKFDSLVMPIDRHVEVCYRNLDISKLLQKWDYVKGIETLLLPPTSVRSLGKIL